jgi:hypothetical protein
LKGATSAADHVFDNKLMRQPAQMTKAEITNIEKVFGSQTLGFTRRASLASLTQSMRELSKGLVKDKKAAVALACLAISAENYAEKLELMKTFMESAAIRLNVALCRRTDMQELMAQVRKEMAETADAG